ncbi:MAG: hypothetical protein ACYDCS_07165 [Candidatus Dormibacteria bacterium]
MEDFFRVFSICLERWQAMNADEDARLCSGDLGELGFDEIRIRRSYLLLTDANLLTGGESTYSTDNGEQYGWDQVIYHTINRYRDVASLDEYLELRRTEMIGQVGMRWAGEPARQRVCLHRQWLSRPLLSEAHSQRWVET